MAHQMSWSLLYSDIVCQCLLLLFFLGCKIHEMLFTFAIPVSQKISCKCADQSNKGLVKVITIELRTFFLSFMMGNPLLDASISCVVVVLYFTLEKASERLISSIFKFFKGNLE